MNLTSHLDRGDGDSVPKLDQNLILRD